MREINSLFSLNRGVIDRRGLARLDVKRLAMAAEVQTNMMPRVLGSMSLRPGLGYLGGIYGNNACRMLKFIFSTADTALLEMTDSTMRVWIDDELVTRPTVTATVTNGTFPTDLSGWTDNDEAGATSAWVSPGYMELVGTGSSFAIRDQAVALTNLYVEHALRIVVARGPVMLRVGSTSGGDEYVRETSLGTGTHSIAFTPSTLTFYIRFKSRVARKVWVQQCTVESAGVMTLPTPYAEADLGNLRIDQSGDTVFVACSGYQQRRIERRGTRPGARSWSVALFQSDDGPFQIDNTTPTTITPSALTGNVTLTASSPIFRSGHVGALYSLTSVGQQTTATTATSGVATPSIRITGIGSARDFNTVISGDASASTVDIQRSYDNATWSNTGTSYTTDGTRTENDGLDNQIVYYRLILTTRVAPDSVTMTLSTGSGSVRGIVRVTDYTSSTSVGAEVLTDLGGTSGTTTWQEGQWSSVNGWPTAVKLHEGRLWWAGQNGIQGSVSDAYDSNDETVVGDSGPINRTIGSGPVDTITWLLSLKGLLVGAQGAEYTARASSLDEILTPTNFNLKTSSTQGSGVTDGIKLDQSGYFVNRSGCKVFELSFDLRAYDYFANDLTTLQPEIGLPGIVRMDAQRLPDTRVHCVRSDGKVALCVLNKVEEVTAWILVETDGVIEDVVTLPAANGALDDQCYYVVARTIGGSTVRYLEKMAQEIDCRGDQDLCYLADSYVSYSGALTATVSAPHLAGEQVVVWADGQDVGTNDSAATWTQRYTLDATGSATLSTPVSSYVVGLPYSGQFKSAKLGALGAGSPLNQQKNINHLGLLLADTHPRGLRFGADFSNLDDMPLIEEGRLIGTATETDYDQNLIEFPGTWTTDARVCLQFEAPRPCTVLAVTYDMQRYS